jgi:hypothetical protein
MPFVGKGEASRETAEQRHTKPPFQLRDLVTDRSLADAELNGGAREIEVTGRGLESTEGIEGKLRAIHRLSMNLFHGSVEK